MPTRRRSSIREGGTPAITYFESAADLRKWFEANHATASELWVGFYRKDSKRGGVTYAEALDQALCFGWIDGVRKKVDALSYTNRFSPRRPRSVWSAVNVARFAELRKRRLVRPAGLAAFEQRDPARPAGYSYEGEPTELDAACEARFRNNRKAWAFFIAQPPFYRRAVSRWVMTAKKEETRLRRLATLIADSEAGRRIPPFGPPRKPA